MDAIQEVGSYAGFAAVIGLAVLSALYFSQGRDVRRLREWAGRAPERSAEQAALQTQETEVPEQAAREAARPLPSGAVRPIPAVKPAGPKPAEAGKPGAPEQPAEAGKDAEPGKPAEAKPGEPAKPPGVPAPATAAASDKKAAPGPAGAPPVPATAAAAAAKPATGPAPATPAAAPAKGTPGAPAKPLGAPAPAPAAASPSPAAIPGRPPAVPARPGPVARSPAATAAAQNTAVMPASTSATRLRDRARRGGSGREGLRPRYIALIVAGVIVIGGGVAFGISQLGGDDDATTSGDSAQNQPQEPVNPSTVTVSVLNGTTVPGLAAQIGDEVESGGFQRGNVANALDQQRTTSVVLYAEGADREAKLVARRLGINTVEPIDPDSQALGGVASVVVIVGADQTQ